MGYNRHYYTHGAVPFAYNWQGRIAQPAHGGRELGNCGSLGAGPFIPPSTQAVTAPPQKTPMIPAVLLGSAVLGLLYLVIKK